METYSSILMDTTEAVIGSNHPLVQLDTPTTMFLFTYAFLAWWIVLI